MDTKYRIFVFETGVPMNLTKGTIYITPYGEDYVNIFRSLSQYEKNVEKIEETEDMKNIFIDRGMYSSSVDFRIKNPTMPRDSVFVQTNQSVPVILNKIKYEEDLQLYDIFSGKQRGPIEPNENDDIDKNIKIFYYVMLQYMNAGYHKGQNKSKIPDWCICFGEPIMKYFIHYFEISTEAPDIGVVDQFLTTPQYREMITIQMMKFMANYVVNNELVDTEDVESWYDIKLWMSIKNKI